MCKQTIGSSEERAEFGEDTETPVWCGGCTFHKTSEGLVSWYKSSQGFLWNTLNLRVEWEQSKALRMTERNTNSPVQGLPSSAVYSGSYKTALMSTLGI